MNRKLDILVPQYKETDRIIKNLLDSIAFQQNIDFKRIGVIIVNDGTDIHLSKKLLKSYPFTIEYHLNSHKGVSATRNACLDHSKAEYVMFCDADDMFSSIFGLGIVLSEMDRNNLDALYTPFIEECHWGNRIVFNNRVKDHTFVHGKAYRRKYLVKKNIRWNESLTIHEDSYFNYLALKLTKKVKYVEERIYLWKNREDSVCRRDKNYRFNTYVNLLNSNSALVREFIRRKKRKDAILSVTSMIYKAYYDLNDDDWYKEENRDFKYIAEKRFKSYYKEFKKLFDKAENIDRINILEAIKIKYLRQGRFTENITFKDWIEHILTLD